MIYEKCGSPSEEDWPGISSLRHFHEFGPKKQNSRKIKALFKGRPK